MLLDDFRRILITFADKEEDINISRGQLLAQIRNDVITAKLTTREDGNLWVDENDDLLPAKTWLINRVARLPLLAERIVEQVPLPSNFVTPTGVLDNSYGYDNNLGDENINSASATIIVNKVLSEHLIGTTSVLYLTSDAGEGKTTLINHMSHQQAIKYKEKKTDWLLVPISLGGRTFLRFDDVIVASLVNKLRFQLYYYESFLELVRLGVVVPAFDGFEEMMIETSTGEAISALGNLLGNLHSAGNVLISARNAYFDYQSFRTQARLFDTMGNDSVAFAQLALNRWSRDQFVEYATKRKLSDAGDLYDPIATHLGSAHPLLTRAVLVRRLVDVAERQNDISSLVDAINRSKQDYLFQFVNALVEREAYEKWIDKSGEPAKPLLTVDEHHELLSMIAQEQWLSSVDSLRIEVIVLIAELFAETKGKSPSVARQISERLKQHCLLISTTGLASSLAFDHDDFRYFYLGEALGRLLFVLNRNDTRELLKRTTLPKLAVDEAILYLQRSRGDAKLILEMLQQLAQNDISASYLRENCGIISIALINVKQLSKILLSSMNFPADALKGIQLESITFSDCYFQPTSLFHTRFERCNFNNCRFERLETENNSLSVKETILMNCQINSIFDKDRDEQAFAPSRISDFLTSKGFQVAPLDQKKQEDHGFDDYDEKMLLVEKTLRTFLRTTQVSDSVLLIRLGQKANFFHDQVLPGLLDAEILKQVDWRGGGSQNRYKLGLPMMAIQDALQASHGSFEDFIEFVKSMK